MKKSGQIISMDFTLSLIIYIFALSGFLFLLGDSIEARSKIFDLPSSLIFSRLQNQPYPLLTQAVINEDVLNQILNQPLPDNHGNDFYNIVLKDFETSSFSRIDYCIFLLDYGKVHHNFAAGKKNEYPIFIETTNKVPCYETGEYTNVKISCSNENAETIMLTKPVYFQNRLQELRLFACAQP